MSENDGGRLARLTMAEPGFAFDPRTGECFSISPSGRVVIAALLDQHDEDELAETLAQRFGTELALVRRELRDFLDQLRVLGLLGERP